MAREISRTFDAAAGAVFVEVEDHFGVKSSHTLYVDGPAEVNIEQDVAGILKERRDRADRLIDKFEKAGADMSAVKAKRAEQNESVPPRDNSAGN